MVHTHRISPVDVHNGPGPHNGFRSYQSYTRYDFGGLQLAHVLSNPIIMRLETLPETNIFAPENECLEDDMSYR